MYYIYVLESLKDHGWYIGSTSDVERRLKDHNYGRTKSTKSRRPLKLIHQEQFSDKQSAEKAEKYYKSGAGRTKLKNLIL